MCGIFAILNSQLEPAELRRVLISCSQKLRHRGPDWSGYEIANSSGIAHERLSIVDPEAGKQPFVHVFPDGNKIIAAANGEVYNHHELYAEIARDKGADFYKPQTGSDCEIFLALYLAYGNDWCYKLNGMYAFAVYDSRDDSFMIGRDHIGIAPMYIGYNMDGGVWVGSEMKSLWEHLSEYEVFPPGHYYDSKTAQFHQWYTPKFYNTSVIPSKPVDLNGLREKLIKCVDRCVIDNAPWGVLLSGGLDSSLMASIAVKLIKEKGLDLSIFHSFSIGVAGSPDMVAAKKVAKFLGITHHAFTYTIEEGCDAIRETIKMLETYDVSTIRSSVPMYLMMRKIKSLGVKVVLGGEGADEIFGGYLYFHKAPNPTEFHLETVDKIKNLHTFDLHRVNICCHAWGVEGRVPFLDPEFLEYAMNIDPKDKMVKKSEGMLEKYILRCAFDTSEDKDDYLPQDILWRQKEQFSDGVGYQWVDGLKKLAESEVSDRMLANAHIRFKYNTPVSKEAYMYRSIFAGFYPNNPSAYTVPINSHSIATSTKRAMAWDPSFNNRADPSGRSIKSHRNSFGDLFSQTSKAGTGVPRRPSTQFSTLPTSLKRKSDSVLDNTDAKAAKITPF